MLACRSRPLPHALERILPRAHLLLGRITLPRRLPLALVVPCLLHVALAIAIGLQRAIALGAKLPLVLDRLDTRLLAPAVALALHRHRALARVLRLQLRRARILDGLAMAARGREARLPRHFA